MHIDRVRKLTDEKWLNLFEATYEHNGHRGRWVFASRREVPYAPAGQADAVIIVPLVFAEGQPTRLAVLREFRVPVGDYVIALPAGLIEEGEDVESTVRRELREETGLEVVRFRRVTQGVCSTAGMTDETTALAFIEARPVDGVGPKPEPSEDMELLLLDYEGVRRLCDDRTLRIDAKAWLVLYLFRELGQLA